MCDPVLTPYIVGGLIGGTALSAASGALNPPKPPAMPAAPAAAPAAQAVKNPVTTPRRQAMSGPVAATPGGSSSTLLTGPAGVATAGLNLGGTSLLGG